MSFDKILKIKDAISEKENYKSSRIFREKIIDPFDNIRYIEVDPTEDAAYKRELKTLTNLLVRKIESHFYSFLIPGIKEQSPDVTEEEIISWQVNANEYLESGIYQKVIAEVQHAKEIAELKRLLTESVESLPGILEDVKDLSGNQQHLRSQEKLGEQRRVNNSIKKLTESLSETEHIELEALLDQDETSAYPLAIEGKFLDPTPMFAALVSDLRAGESQPILAARFHNTIAQLMRQVCLQIRSETSIDETALSGGVWQNMTLLRKTIHILESDNFKIFLHHQVPANDGGISLGQAVIAMTKLDL